MTKASQWLKVLIVNTGLPVVVCGMPEAEYVLSAEQPDGIDRLASDGAGGFSWWQSIPAATAGTLLRCDAKTVLTPKALHSVAQGQRR
jgi:hypothetical protein